MVLRRRLYKVYGTKLDTIDRTCACRNIPALRSPSASAASRTSGSSIESTLPPRRPRLSGVSRSILPGESMPIEELFLGDNCEGPGW